MIILDKLLLAVFLGCFLVKCVISDVKSVAMKIASKILIFSKIAAVSKQNHVCDVQTIYVSLSLEYALCTVFSSVSLLQHVECSFRMNSEDTNLSAALNLVTIV